MAQDDVTDWRKKLELLVLQPTPFCNLDCDYCYLPERNNHKVMDFGVLEAIAWKVFSAGLPSEVLSIVWHAGEPLVVSREWYRKAISIMHRHCRDGVSLVHNIQTNGVLVDDAWCEFFLDHQIRVGVSIDGPMWLHDAHRRTRSGNGTHAQVMRGVEALKRNGVPFHVICVLTSDSLPCADELFDFFEALGQTCLCFNIDEIEAANGESSLLGEKCDEQANDLAFRHFFSRMVQRHRVKKSIQYRIREIDSVLGALRSPHFGKLGANCQNQAGRILTVAWDGSFYTFSPELAGVSHPQLGRLSLGNILFDSLPPQANGPFDAQEAEIRAGVERCKAECKYFDLCLGGAPSNKLGENGSFNTSETRFCRLMQKAVADVVLEALDEELS